jgi:ferric-dicitrate binding protein FerR (iron transport regulator)
MELSREQLKELAYKYFNGNATEAEQQLLHDWYDTVNEGELEIVLSEFPQDIVSLRDASWKEMRGMMAGSRPVAERNAQTAAAGQSAEAVVAELPGSSLRFTSWRRMAIAACFVLLLGLAARWYWQRPMPSQAAAPAVAGVSGEKTDAAPGGNRAILTLDNGQTIVLDSAKKGALAVQGNMQVLKLDDGKIVYRKNGSGAPDGSGISYNLMSTPRGGQYQLTLPDGTRVWLNAASSIRYPTAFAGRDRRVEVHGEAYFQVAANPRQPFVVDVNKKQTIEVLGTEFNVNAYEDEAFVRTTLIRGGVRVTGGAGSAKGKTSRVLLPGQQVQLDEQGSMLLIDHPNIDATLAWRNGIFSFDHSDIRSVMRELARWYDMDVEYRGTPTSDTFGGDIRRNLSLSKVFRILEKSQVHFTIEHGKIIVMP